MLLGGVFKARSTPQRLFETLSPAKAAALQEVQSSLGAVRDAQRSGNFAQYGAALQRLDEAMGKFDAAK